MKTLDQLLIEYGSDKATEHTRTYAKPHGYSVILEKYFEPLRDKPIKFLEVGVGGGESIQAWVDYFPNAQIYGIDFIEQTNPYNFPGKSPLVDRYTFSHGDQADRTMWKCFIANYGSSFDVICEDGGHFNDQTIITFEELWPHVKSGGLYCVEDLAVCYGVGSVFNKAGFPKHNEWISQLMDGMHQGQNDIYEMHISKELCIMRKR